MKTLKMILMVMILSSTACSHVYTRSWGSGQVTTCCPHGKIFCTASKMEKEAEDKCGGTPVTPIGGELVSTGADFNFTSSRSISSRERNDSCTTYRCGQ